MATNDNPNSGGLFGLDQFLANQPPSPSVTGGVGESPSGIDQLKALLPGLAEDEREPQGLGPLMEADGPEAFKTIDEMVRRQEPLARSRLAQDAHYTYVKLGFPFSSLEKEQDQDVYRQSFPPGYAMRQAAVPNKAADLVNKLTETLLVDAAQPDPQPETDDESAVQAAKLASEFLQQDGGEAGTDDRSLFWSQVERATTCSSSFLWPWVDETGGGTIAKQVKAHPQATDPANPLDAVDPMTGQPLPTTDYVLRYVTPDGQFTDNPSEAERVWVPRIRVNRLGREHVRFFPETKDLHDAEAVVCIFYTTVGEAKRRWPDVAQMSDAQIGALCDWNPPRPSALLPASLRARWRAASNDSDKTVNDERILFFYAYLRRSDPTYSDGAQVFVSGANGGVVLHRDTLVAEVEVPSETKQDVTVTDRRDMDIPLIQIRLLQDPDGGDPMGKPVMARIAAAGEAGARIASSLLSQIDKILHPARFVTATSPLSDDDIEESRAGGRLAVVTSQNDFPKYEEPPDLPSNTLDVVDWNYTQMDSAIGLNKPAQGSDDSAEVSGVARRIAVQQSLVSVSRMQHGVNVAWERYWRIKLQLVMRYFGVPQLLRYVGVDGAAKQEWFKGADFARVTGVTVKPGSGTLLPPNEKVNYAIQLRDAGLVDPDTATDIATPGFMKVLGVPDNPHLQRIERQVSSWLEGPPEGWVETFDANQMMAQQVEAEAMQAQTMGIPAQMPAIPPQWTPFATLPMDADPAIAALRKRRLATLMASVKFSAQPEQWQSVVIQAYNEAAMASAPAPMMPADGGQPMSPELPPEAAVAV